MLILMLMFHRRGDNLLRLPRPPRPPTAWQGPNTTGGALYEVDSSRRPLPQRGKEDGSGRVEPSSARREEHRLGVGRPRAKT